MQCQNWIMQFMSSRNFIINELSCVGVCICGHNLF
jgi:hypothetical protein